MQRRSMIEVINVIWTNNLGKEKGLNLIWIDHDKVYDKVQRNHVGELWHIKVCHINISL